MHPSVAYDHRAIVKRRLVKKDIGYDARIRHSVHLRACGGYVVQHIFLFKHHQRTHLLLLECAERLYNAVDGIQLCLMGIVFLAKQYADGKFAPAHVFEKAAQFRLEYNDHG